MKTATTWAWALVVAGSLAWACSAPIESPLGLVGKADGEAVEAHADPDIAALLAGTVEFQSEFRDEALAVALPDTPDYSADSPRFSFCADPVRPEGMNLTNATWLAYFAITEYSHLAVITPTLRQLGFGTTADDDWAECALGLRQLRRLECVPEKREQGTCSASCLPASMASGAALQAAAERPQCSQALDAGAEWTLGCVTRWLDDRVARFQGSVDWLARETATNGMSARFQKWLIRTTHADKKIKYFAGGAFATEDGSKTFAEGSTQAIWAEHPDKNVIIVSFRGTEGDQKTDILTDADFRMRDLSDWGWGDGWGEGHLGFLRAYKSIWKQLVTLIGQQRNRADPPGIWITGHSLGGALATLFTAKVLELIELGYPINLKGMYTFGSPRVGDEDFVRKVTTVAQANDVALVRVKHIADIVTRVPKEFMGFEHVGQIAYLPELAAGRTPIKLEDGDDFFFGRAGHHSMIHYYQRTHGAMSWARESQPDLDRCAAP